MTTNVCYLCYLQFDDIVEALLEMRLHGLRVLTLTKNLQQVVVRQEVESGEYLPLRLEVHVQRLLYLLQLQIHVVELLQQACQSAESIMYLRVYQSQSAESIMYLRVYIEPRSQTD